MWLVAPDTEILTTDGRMEQIQDIRIGDTIVGRGAGIKISYPECKNMGCQTVRAAKGL